MDALNQPLSPPSIIQQGQGFDCLCFSGSSEKPHEKQLLPPELSDFQGLQFLNASDTQSVKKKI